MVKAFLEEKIGSVVCKELAELSRNLTFGRGRCVYCTCWIVSWNLSLSGLSWIERAGLFVDAVHGPVSHEDGEV